MFLHWILDYLECFPKLEVISDVSLTSVFVYLAFNRPKRIPHSPHCRVAWGKIDPLLTMKVNTVDIHQILLIWISVMERTLDLSEHFSEIQEVKEREREKESEREGERERERAVKVCNLKDKAIQFFHLVHCIFYITTLFTKSILQLNGHNSWKVLRTFSIETFRDC